MKKRNLYLIVAVAALVTSALACNLPFGQSDTQSPGDEPAPGDAAQGGEDTSGDTGQGAGADLFAPVPGGQAIIQTTPESGNGPHPEFAWQPVDGAARYMLFVVDEQGLGYWSWEGTATSVILGGFDTPPPDTAEGPRLTEPLQWAVVALDANDSFIASSPLRPVAP